MSIKKLPPEILTEIFSNVPSLKRLCQCRLVCKSWNDIAEKNMLGRRIRLKTNTGATSFAYFLSQKPDLDRRIKYLTLNFYSSDDEPPVEQIFVNLLKLVFTPNMVELRGSFQGPAVFNEMIRIKENAALPFDQLAVMPDPATHDENLESYYAAALAFQESLTELVIKPGFPSAQQYNSFVAHLDGFKRLTWLILDRQSINAAQLHHILDKCHRLTTLSFKFGPSNKGHAPLTASESTELVKPTSVNTGAPLNYVDFECSIPCPDLVEYLMAKYTNIQNIRGHMSLEHMHSLDDSHSLFRIINAIKKVRFCNTSFILYSDLPHKSIESKLQAGNRHSLTVKDKRANGWKQVAMKDEYACLKRESSLIISTKLTKRFYGE